MRGSVGQVDGPAHRETGSRYTPVHFHVSRLHLSIHWIPVAEATHSQLAPPGVLPVTPPPLTSPPYGLSVLVTVECIECPFLIHPQAYV